MVEDGVDSSMVEGVIDSPYAIADFSVDVHNASSAVSVQWWRSVRPCHGDDDRSPRS
jgi:isoquinoline 1-oxidoreductase beta subunit